MLDDKDTFQSRALGQLNGMLEETAYLIFHHPDLKAQIRRNCEIAHDFMISWQKDIDLEISLIIAFKGLV